MFGVCTAHTDTSNYPHTGDDTDSQDDDKMTPESHRQSETTPHKVSDKVREVQRQSSVEIARSFSRLIDSGQLIWRARKEGRDGAVFITFKLYLTQRAICGSRRAVGDIVNVRWSLKTEIVRQLRIT